MRVAEEIVGLGGAPIAVGLDTVELDVVVVVVASGIGGNESAPGVANNRVNLLWHSRGTKK